MPEPVGIIYPPPELRGIVDRTATYVAKNGTAFEARIMREHEGKPKFSFLFTNDPFNAYYRHKVNEIRNSLLSSTDSSNEQNKQQQTDDDRRTVEAKGESDRSRDEEDKLNKDGLDRENVDSSNKLQEDDHDNQSRIQDKSDRGEGNDDHQPQVKTKLDEYIQEKTVKLQEPPALNFLASPGSILSHLECDVIKLTSQYIATYGRAFLLELVSREQNNSLFDFLKPQHGQFPYMTNLVMQYALIQNCPLDILEHLEKDAKSQRHVLEKIKMRAEWNRMLEVERKKKEEAEEREKELYNQIDWHDFVIVETVDYQPGDKGEYPPTTANQVGTRLLKQQRLEDHRDPEEMEIDMDVDSDQGSEPGGAIAGQLTDTDEFVVPQPPDAAAINIRKDYDPKAAPKAAAPIEPYYVSPITNERIPVDKIHEHVQYNLSDPSYQDKKRQTLQGKMNEEDVFASGSQIQDSLKHLAERRTDIFGMNDAETTIGQRFGELESDQPKKDNRIIWDGHKSSLKKVKRN